MNDYLYHHGIKGQKWGVRRYQNYDGTWTEAGKERYGTAERMTNKYNSLSDSQKKALKIGAAAVATAAAGSAAYLIGTKTEVGKEAVMSLKLLRTKPYRDADGKLSEMGQLLYRQDGSKKTQNNMSAEEITESLENMKRLQAFGESANRLGIDKNLNTNAKATRTIKQKIFNTGVDMAGNAATTLLDNSVNSKTPLIGEELANKLLLGIGTTAIGGLTSALKQNDQSNQSNQSKSSKAFELTPDKKAAYDSWMANNPEKKEQIRQDRQNGMPFEQMEKKYGK